MYKVQKRSAFSSSSERVITYVLVYLGIASVVMFGCWWFRLSHIPSNFTGVWHLFDIALFILLSYVVWYQIINELLAWDLALNMKVPVPTAPEPGLRVALLSAFVPGKEPIDMLERTLKAMVNVEYPHDTWILDEGDDVEVKALCARLGVKHFTRKGIPHFNTESGKFKAKTKGGNYNSWFKTHSREYDIVAQHDVDFIPCPDFLMKTLGYFKDPEVAFVGTPQIYGNEDESWIARAASQQAYGFYGPLQKGLFGHDMQLFIGANHVMRVAAHNDITGYAGHIVEDHLTGMKLYSKNWKSVFVPEVLLVGEGPATWDAYFSQQMRWSYGLMDILFRHSPSIFPTMDRKHGARYFLLQQYYFYGLAQVLGIALMMLFFLFGIESTTMHLLSLLSFYLLMLLIQTIIFSWTQRFYIRPKEEAGFHIEGKIMNIAAWPIYFMAFVGALLGKKLSYQVTPKGSAQHADAAPVLGLFTLHFVLGTTTAIGLMVALLTHHTAPLIMFWAATNTLFMYGFVLRALYEDSASYVPALKRMLKFDKSSSDFIGHKPQ